MSMHSTTARTVVKFNDVFYLRHKDGQYLISADRGQYNCPRFGDIGKVKLQLEGREEAESLKDGDRVKIRSLERLLGDYNILGAFSDSYDCYCWQDGYNPLTQSWIIHKVFSDGDVICYGDEVYIANFSDLNQRLAIDRKNYGYITTRKNALDRWIIESAENKHPVIESDISNPASVYGLSFASENALDTGVILWTRIHQEVYKNKESFKYQLCHTDKFDEGVLEGEIQTSLDKKRDYTVYVDFNNCLERGNSYYYRFVYRGIFSKVSCCQILRKHDVYANKFRLAILTFRVL